VASWHVVGSKTFSVKVYPQNPINSWSATIDKTQVKPGDIMNVAATVNWEWPGSIQLKLRVTGFNGKLDVTTQPVTVASSPTTIKAPITVPNVQGGTYNIQVYLNAYY